MPIYDATLLAALERLQLRTRRPLAGSIAGEHRSRRYGSSLDFADFREYQPGDDFRRIDYQSLARLDQLFLRLYEAEDDLEVRLVVDTSASMGLDDKLHRAAEVAAAVGFVALTRRDVVSVHTNRSRAPRRFSSRTAWPLLRDHLAGLSAEGAGSLVEVATGLLSRGGPGGLTVLVSDLLDPEWEAGLRRLPARGADLVVVHVLGAGELEPDVAGDVDLVDIETGRRLPMSLTDESIARFSERRDQWLADVEHQVNRLGAAYTMVSAQADLRAVVLRSLLGAEVLA